MDKDSKQFSSILFRYLLLILIAIPGLDLFYFFFLPLTKYPVLYFLNLFYNAVMAGDVIFVGQKAIEVVGACVAGSAYYFLLILNLSTPKIKIGNRLKMIAFAFLTFLIINLIRIFILSLMYLNDSPIFDVSHKVFWYMGSTIVVVLIWFVEVKTFGVEKIPFYSDLKELYKKSSLKKRKKSKRS